MRLCGEIPGAKRNAGNIQEMSLRAKAQHILAELKGHAPFTLFGAFLGIVFMLLFRNVSDDARRTLFTVFHPTHVVLSAIVTASMFKLHAAKRHFLVVLIVGYFGSIGIATLSDIIIPHIGTHLLALDVPSHAQVHGDNKEPDNHQGHGPEDETAHPRSRIHLGFIDDWYIVNPAALLGIFIAFFLPRTKFPHAGHVLISTWASSSYLLMNTQSEITAGIALGIFVTLFVATLLPCCISDIVFPLLFVKPDLRIAEPCEDHGLHSHPHVHDHTEQTE